MPDLSVADAQVLDGTGAPAGRADVGVTGDGLYAGGIEHVIVNCRGVVRGGEHTTPAVFPGACSARPRRSMALP